jgi:hypothetical protein
MAKKKKLRIFKDLRRALRDALAFEKGKNAGLRVTRT